MPPDQTQTPISDLSLADIHRLKADPSVQVRIDTAAKVAVQFDQASLSRQERQIAEDILRAMLKDAEVSIRETLANQLKSSPNLPKDVALALAHDVESVALPILEFSEVLTDQDLIEIVRGGSADKQSVIAQRASLSVELAGALIDSGNETAVARLAANQNATLNADLIGTAMNRYPGSGQVYGALASRPKLPPELSEKLMVAVTRQVERHLVQRRRMPVELVRGMVVRARERATISLLAKGCASEAELMERMDQLRAKKKLNTALAMRALSMGDLQFFEAAMACLAGTTLENARTLIYDHGPLGLEAIMDTALKVSRH